MDEHLILYYQGGGAVARWMEVSPCWIPEKLRMTSTSFALFPFSLFILRLVFMFLSFTNDRDFKVKQFLGLVAPLGS